MSFITNFFVSKQTQKPTQEKKEQPTYNYDENFGQSSHFIARIKRRSAEENLECAEVDTDEELIEIKKCTFKDFLYKKHIKNNSAEHIRKKLKEFYEDDEEEQIFLDIEFDKTHLNLENFAFILTKHKYDNNKVTAMNIIRNIQLTHKHIVPDRTHLYVGTKKMSDNDNIINFMIKQYIIASKTSGIYNKNYNKEQEIKHIKKSMPKLIIKWNPLVIDMFIKDYTKFEVKSTSNLQPLWNIVDKKYDFKKYCLKPRESSKDAIEKMKKNDKDKKYVYHLGDAEKTAIHLYTIQGLYDEFNNVCRMRKTNEIKVWKPLGLNMITALKKLPYYWGWVYRGVNRKWPGFDKEYQKDNIVLWDAFSSTTKTVKIAENFAHWKINGIPSKQGFIFRIKSWRGRWIQPLSYFNNEEEVLFVASTYFKILSIEKNPKSINVGNKTEFLRNITAIITMEEIVSPWAKKAILWVDDKPKNNLKQMEALEREGVMIIPRTSTQTATDFLEYELPCILHRDFTNFRIVTDMGRLVKAGFNEGAGAKFIQILRNKSYYHLVCIFCNDAENARKQCKEHNLNMNSVLITTKVNELMSFCRKELICPGKHKKKSDKSKKDNSNVIYNSEDDSKIDINDNNNSKESGLVFLQKRDVAKTYKGHGANKLKCDVCGKKPEQLVYHCPEGRCDAHKKGFDVCEKCALQVLAGKEKLQIPDDLEIID